MNATTAAREQVSRHRPALLRLAIAGLVFVTFVAARAAAAEGIRHEPVTIPAGFPGSGTLTLEALVLRPADDAPHPLALVNHGSPRDERDRAKMSPFQMWPEAMEFARRGWTTVVVERRGYGRSEGHWAEGYGSCNNPNYIAAGQAAAADLTAAIAFMSKQPYVDSSRIISVGVSAGGFATVALAANPPPGLKAAISFAGGRGSQSADHVCNDDKLTEAFRYLGQHSRVPMLWVYAENDHFFGPAVAKRSLAAFTSGGGKVTFIAEPPFGKDGHTLFSQRGIPRWTPAVDRFLAAQGLMLRAHPIELAIPHVPPPAGLDRDGIADFKDYLAAGPNKAFAANADGSYGWVSGRRSESDARADALRTCAGFDKGCKLVNVNDAPAR